MVRLHWKQAMACDKKRPVVFHFHVYLWYLVCLCTLRYIKKSLITVVLINSDRIPQKWLDCYRWTVFDDTFYMIGKWI